MSEAPGKKVLVVFGTRPEAIKMAPVVHALAQAGGIESRICVTAQHRSMLDEALRVFDLKPDYDLDLMRRGQSLSGIASAVIGGIDPVLEEFRPAWVLVQGDTTTTMATSLAAFHRRIKVGHVEAGLRTGDLSNPYPEEANRRITSVVTARHYCPTERSRQQLLKEGYDDATIRVTGNTVIDALQMSSARIDGDADFQTAMARRFSWIDAGKRLILVTGHRRESFGEGILQICKALAILSERDDVQVVYPVHLNPNVCGPVFELLGGRPSVKLIEPLDYLSFIWMMKRCSFILTDSGGVQEEAPTLGKPVLVMRETTERPEGIDAGTSRLVGTGAEQIVAEAASLLDDPNQYERMSRAKNPFGDGTASKQIVRDLMNGDV
jgi:UDP-N-acetylglucosamine 2-epimerase (non-hydrolysing)